MKRKNATRNALFTSVLSLLLCVSMLVGTTYAWFTDTESTGINTIQSGNLDLEVYYAYPSDVVNGDIPTEAWKPVRADESVFNEDALWEPGYTEVVFFKIDNAGSLAFQYQFQIDILNEVLGKTEDGADIQLSNYIQAYAAANADWAYKSLLFTDRNTVTNPPYAPSVFSDTLYNVANMGVCRADDPYTNALSLDHWQWLNPDETYYVTLALWMPTTIGNEANHDGENQPKIDLGINVLATQYNWENEKDSFDHNYDKDAEFPELMAPPLTSADDLQKALNDGGQFALGSNIALDKSLTVNPGVEVEIDLAGFDIIADAADGNSALIVDGGTLTLKNKSAVDASIKIDGANIGQNLPAVSVKNGGVLNIDGVNLEVGGDQFASAVQAYGSTVNFNSGKIVVDGTVNSYGIAAMYDSTVNMNGGEIVVDNGRGIFSMWGNVAGNTINLNGGKITVNAVCGVGAMEGKTIVNVASGFEFIVNGGVDILDMSGTGLTINR